MKIIIRISVTNCQACVDISELVGHLSVSNAMHSTPISGERQANVSARRDVGAEVVFGVEIFHFQSLECLEFDQLPIIQLNVHKSAQQVGSEVLFLLRSF